ncbi:MAG: hypothetical protein DRQ55_07995 [Planctomycetota bacterium]|nr:MAG: hypothetical protein DRQ55_07995 [Planctomycetota bacterium]
MTHLTSQHLLVPALLGALCLPALAGEITKPSGFNIETMASAGPVVEVLADGSLLLASAGPTLTRQAPDGTLTLFAEGFSSIDGVSQSTLSGDIAVGDLFSPDILWLLRDLNHDGDALDPGERTVFPSTHPLLANGRPALAFDVAYEPGTDTLYMIGTTQFISGETSLPAIVRHADGAGGVYFDELGFSGGLAFREGVLYAGSLHSTFFVGEVFALQDMNDDGDAMDPGENGLYATGLTGASGLAFAQDGSLWISGGSSPSFAGCVGRLLPDSNADGMADGVEECVFEGFAYSGGLTLFEGAGGFNPGADGEGELWIGDFGFQGNDIARSAPLAETEVVGNVALNEVIDVIVRGAAFADGMFVISLDTSGPTFPGIGDLCAGFNDLHAISPLMDLGPDGEATCRMSLRDLEFLQGRPLVIQAFTLEDGVFGIGNGLEFIFGS